MNRYFTSAKATNTVILLIANLVFAPEPRAGEPTGPLERLSRTNLLVRHNAQGRIVNVKTKGDWEKRRAEIVAGMNQVMGALPGKDKRCALDPRVETEMDCGPYIRRLLSYASEPGSRVPAYLLVPKAALQSKDRFPAVLALHPTDMEYGHRVVVEPMRNHYRAYAHDLALRGFVVLAPAYPLLANYQPDLKTLGYQSGTMKAIWDNIRGLDLLESMPFVKKRRIGAIGHSLGGHNAIFTAVFDQRLAMVISSCGFDSFVDYMDGRIKGWTSERYMPRLADYQQRLEAVPFDFFELIAALAPRPVFINAPLGDSNFKWQSVDRIVASAAQVYDLYKAGPRLQVVHPDCGHDFPPEIRESAYQLLETLTK